MFPLWITDGSGARAMVFAHAHGCAVTALLNSRRMIKTILVAHSDIPRVYPLHIY